MAQAPNSGHRPMVGTRAIGGSWVGSGSGREWSGRGRAGASGQEQSIKVGKGGSSSAGVGAAAGQEQQGKEMVAGGGRWWQKGSWQAAKGWMAGGRWQKGRQQVAGGRRADWWVAGANSDVQSPAWPESPG
jgi:hypothetical protein